MRILIVALIATLLIQFANTVVVPVLFKQSKFDEKTAAKQYKVVVNNPKDGLDFLIAVSRVMNSLSKKS